MTSNAFSKSTKRRLIREEVDDLVFVISNSSSECESSMAYVEQNTSPITNIKNKKELSENTAEKEYFEIPIGGGSVLVNNVYVENSLNSEDNIISSSESDSGDNLIDNILHKLSNWAVKHKITNVALSDLLKVLHYNHKCFHDFPVDARTLLQTKTSKQSLAISEMYPGMYHHFGLEKGIKNTIGNLILKNETVKILLGIDGLPLAKSSASQFWPILCYIDKQHIIKSPVFLVGLYWGKQKPKNSNNFLSELVKELKELCVNGIYLPCGKRNIEVHAFCCDMPARSYILGTKGHGGFSSCTKCTTTGVYLDRRVCFPEVNFTKRTHEQFVNKHDDDYQIGDMSILTEIPCINMVDKFPNDYMHCVLLGCVRKIILLWLGNIKNAPLSARLQSRKVNDITVRLLHLRSSITSDFARLPREINEVMRYKATEFRFFILYSGPVVLKSIISKPFYSHFLCLHVSMTILLSHRHGQLIDFTNNLLIYFVQKFGELYGDEFISHNIHSLLHLCDDYKNYGPLDNCSCFPFENFMQVLKKMVRSNAKPLEQVIKRYEEYLTFNNSHHENLSTTCNTDFRKPHTDGPLIQDCSSPQFKIYSGNNVLINIKSSANCFIGGCINGSDLLIMKVLNICFNSVKKKMFLFVKSLTP